MSIMELNHFSHEHPLVFTDEAGKEGGKEVECCGCKKSISGSAYSCGECDYFLHKKCAELPVEIQYPMHPEHALTLFKTPTYWDENCCTCNVCEHTGWRGFTYHCEICEFDVDILCVLDEGTIEHKGHHHPLTLLLRESTFDCNACKTKGEGEQSYLCTKCPFWIHKTCALAPTTITHTDHPDHPLVLAFSLPYEYRSFMYFCEICKHRAHMSRWVYYCDKCRYFLHMKCANTTRVYTGNIIADDPETIIRFPLSADESINLLSRLMNEVSLEGNESESETEPEFDHFSHDHVLSLLDEQSRSITDDEEVLCDCCIQPITTTPYYGCIECSYFLHKRCTNLPGELKHLCHPDHLLELCAPGSFLGSFKCNSCVRYGNGCHYLCETCNYYLDFNCAFFPNIIKHEGHKHPMHISVGGDGFRCEACADKCSESVFVCDGCEYRIGISCVGLPTTIKHDWDDQPLILSYPPYSDHPGYFICEICEEEMHPKRWAYRSHCGLLFFHLYCVIPVDFVLKIKFGGTVTVKNHPHPLRYVRKSKNKSPLLCNICGKDCKGIPVAECAPCNFVLHAGCCVGIIV